MEPKDRDLYREDEDSAIPNLQDEFEITISDMAQGNEPTTVTHALLQERERGISQAAIANKVGKTSFQIEGTLAVMEAKGWVIRYPENGREKFIICRARREES